MTRFDRLTRRRPLGLFTLSVTVAFALPIAADESPADPAALKLLRTFVDEFVDISPGQGRFPKSFEMGSTEEAAERPVQKVTFTDDFAIAKYEVPQNLYTAVMGNNSSRWPGPRNSAERMTWRDAVMFCQRITDRLRAAKLIEPDEVIRLPSEAEWEYCCRAGTTTAYSFGEKATVEGDMGNKATQLDPYAWHTGNAAGNDPAVGVLKPNPWGLYDMHGYLWEFTADDWDDDSTDAVADEAPIVLRGGSWKDHHRHLRSSSRRPFARTHRDDAVGIRCVRATVLSIESTGEDPSIQ